MSFVWVMTIQMTFNRYIATSLEAVSIETPPACG
jgi:hypothetical protein